MSAHAGAALRIARTGGGKLFHAPKPAAPLHAGPINSSVAGRTDHLPMHVGSGSYVLPADIVSHLGQGNTQAGFKVLRRVFKGAPYGGKGGPYSSGSGPYGASLARGGETGDGSSDEGVPIVAAGGEHVLTPDEVRWAGDGDMDTGHKVLDEFVLRTRAEAIKVLKHLPGPAQS